MHILDTGMPLPTRGRSIASIVGRHAQEAAMLGQQRGVFAQSAQNSLRHLRRIDDRIAAHLDGLSVAGEAGWFHCEAGLAQAGPGELFAATVMAIETRNAARLGKLLALAEAMPECRSGLHLAFAWVSAQFLQGTISSLFASSSPFHRQVGIAACAMHQVDPGRALDAALGDADVALRACALRVAGQAGRRDLLGECSKAMDDGDPNCRFEAAWSAALLGEREGATAILKHSVLQAGPRQARALRLILKMIDPAQANLLLRELASQPLRDRLLIQGAGMAGDASYIPWLLTQMQDRNLARLAGEAVATIAGLDLALLDYDGKPPENIAAGPNDDPGDDDVEMDEDDGLPWPDRVKLQSWWQEEQVRFATGVRYFLGQPVTLAQASKVLREGCQRQRKAAAEYLCLLRPGTPLFPTDAPAWRQERWLARMD
ncbi:conserved hypothetical protein [Duganella sp. CF458]|uniref:TIGR02270 family protein n=1 Tax=Duganella sp. CF458 TaxID=1884368 RepID=UPI0008EB0C0C|nr:TIGR02270 family protein [Duganella sp. CF458]SFG09723.1 conserved hypothetical protein [Duganella sp. CF458]